MVVMRYDAAQEKYVKVESLVLQEIDIATFSIDQYITEGINFCGTNAKLREEDLVFWIFVEDPSCQLSIKSVPVVSSSLGLTLDVSIEEFMET